MTTFTIYYGTKTDGDPKIGVCSNYPSRCKVQHLTNYYAMEEHTCIDEVSQREIDLQIQYFGKRDSSSTYKQQVALLEKYRVTFNSETAGAAGRLAVNRGSWANGDQAARGRNNKGNIRKDLAINNKQKRHLTFEQAEEIRAKYIPRKYSMATLAKEYNTTTGVVGGIVRNLSYLTP